MTENPFTKHDSHSSGPTVFQRLLLSRDKQNQSQQLNERSVIGNQSQIVNTPFLQTNTNNKINKIENVDTLSNSHKQVKNQQGNNVQIGKDDKPYSPIRRLAQDKLQKQHVLPASKIVVQQKTLQTAENKQTLNEILRKVVKVTIESNNVTVGNFQVNEQLFEKNLNIPKLSFSPQYKQQLKIMKFETVSINRELNLSLLKNNSDIFVQYLKHQNISFSMNIINRLKKGFQFYSDNNSYDKSMNKVLNQNIQRNKNIKFCQDVLANSNKYKVNKMLSCYMTFHCDKWKVSKQNKSNYLQFLIQDRIFLLKLYRELYTHGRLSTKKLVKCQEEIKELRYILQYYSQKYKENMENSPQQTQSLGRQMIQLFSTILVKNHKQITDAQFTNYFIPMIKQLIKIFPQQHRLRWALDKILLTVATVWPNQIKNMNGLGKIQLFLQFYGDGHEKTGPVFYRSDVKILQSIMVRLHQIAEYGADMKKIVVHKVEQFAEQSQNENIKQPSIIRTMQAILLIKQYKKTGVDIYSQNEGNEKQFEKLLKIIYDNSPVTFLYFVDSEKQYQNLSFPLVSRYYKNNQQYKKWITLSLLNQYLPVSYQIQTNSENYVILKYLFNLIDFYSRNSIDNVQQSLEHLQICLQKLNAGASYMIGDHYLRVVKLISKYLINYGKQINQHFTHNNNNNNNNNNSNNNNNKYQQIHLLLASCRKTINSLLNMYRKQKKQSKHINFHQSQLQHQNQQYRFMTLLKLISNVDILAQSLVTSGIIFYVGSQSIEIIKQYKQILKILRVLSEELKKQSNDNKEMEKKLMEIIIKIYQLFEQNFININNHNNKYNKYIIYLLTVLIIDKLHISVLQKSNAINEINTLFANNIHINNINININNVVQELISITELTNMSNDKQMKQFVKLSLHALFIFIQYCYKCQTNKNKEKCKDLQSIIAANYKTLIDQCFQAINNFNQPDSPQGQQIFKSDDAVYSALCPVFYCDLVAELLLITKKNRNSTFLSIDKTKKIQKNPTMNQNKESLIFRNSVFSKERQPSSTNSYEKLIDSVYGNHVEKNQHTKYIQISFAELCLKYDSFLLSKLVEKDCIIPVSKLLLSQTQKYLNKVMKSASQNPSQISGHLSKQEQQKFKEYVCRCLNIYIGLFECEGIWYQVKQQYKIFNVLWFMIKNMKIQEKGEQECCKDKIKKFMIEMVVWTKFIYTTINNELRTNPQFGLLIEQVIAILAQTLCKYPMSQQQITQLYPYMPLTLYEINKNIAQLIMRFTMQQDIVLGHCRLKDKKMEKLSVIGAMLVVAREVLGVLSNPTENGMIESQQCETYFRCTVITLFKICQFANMHHLASKNDSSKNLREQAQKTVKFIEKMKSSQIFDSIKKQNQLQLIGILVSANEQLLAITTNNSNTNYSNYTEILITLAMHEKKSFIKCYIGLMQQIYKFQNKKQNKVAFGNNSNKYRYYYLLYYFYRKVLEDCTGKFVNYFYQETQERTQMYQKLEEDVYKNVKQLLYYLIQEANKQDRECQSAWRVTLTLLVLRTHISMLREGIFALRISQFCSRNLQYLSNPQHKDNVSHWILYVKCVSIMVLIYRSNVYCHIAKSDGLMGVIRRSIFAKMQLSMLKWKNIRCKQNEKLIELRVGLQYQQQDREHEQSAGSKQWLRRTRLVDYKLTKIGVKQQNKQLQQEQDVTEIKQLGVMEYIKMIMVLVSASCTLNYYREDIMTKSVISEIYKINFLDYVQELLREFAHFYDCYFGESAQCGNYAQTVNHNLESVAAGVDCYLKDPIITRKQNYLNKIMRQFTSLPTQMTLQIFPRNIQRIATEHHYSLSAVAIYSWIEDGLESMGALPTYKFKQNKASLPNVSNSTKKSIRYSNFKKSM